MQNFYFLFLPQSQAVIQAHPNHDATKSLTAAQLCTFSLTIWLLTQAKSSAWGSMLATANDSANAR